VRGRAGGAPTRGTTARAAPARAAGRTPPEVGATVNAPRSGGNGLGMPARDTPAEPDDQAELDDSWFDLPRPEPTSEPPPPPIGDARDDLDDPWFV